RSSSTLRNRRDDRSSTISVCRRGDNPSPTLRQECARSLIRRNRLTLSEWRGLLPSSSALRRRPPRTWAALGHPCGRTARLDPTVSGSALGRRTTAAGETVLEPAGQVAGWLRATHLQACRRRLAPRITTKP